MLADHGGVFINVVYPVNAQVPPARTYARTHVRPSARTPARPHGVVDDGGLLIHVVHARKSVAGQRLELAQRLGLRHDRQQGGRTSAGHALDMHWACAGLALNMRYTRIDMRWARAGHVLDIPWICVGPA